jgi:hypothetical protein
MSRTSAAGPGPRASTRDGDAKDSTFAATATSGADSFWRLKLSNMQIQYPLVNIQKAIENGSFRVDLPIKDGDFPVRYVSLPEGTHTITTRSTVDCSHCSVNHPRRPGGSISEPSNPTTIAKTTNLLPSE